MKHACLVPETHEEDLTGAMVTSLRVAGMTFGGSAEDVEERAFGILWRSPSAVAGNGYSFDQITPRLAEILRRARELGPIDLETAGG